MFGLSTQTHILQNRGQGDLQSSSSFYNPTPNQKVPPHICEGAKWTLVFQRYVSSITSQLLLDCD